MRRHSSIKFSRVLLAGFGLLLGLVMFNKLLKLAILGGVAFLIWKIFFEEDPAPRRALVLPANVPLVNLDPIPVEPFDEAAAERARLDRELEQAIAAAKARGVGTAT
jgi:hypothetical protein